MSASRRRFLLGVGSPLKNVLKYDLFKNKSCGCEGVRLEVSLTRATTPYSFTPNLASSGSYPLVGSRPSYLRVHSSRYYATVCGSTIRIGGHDSREIL